VEDASTELKARLRLHLTQAMGGKRATQTCDSAGQSERAAELRHEADLISRYLAGLRT